MESIKDLVHTLLSKDSFVSIIPGAIVVGAALVTEPSSSLLLAKFPGAEVLQISVYEKWGIFLVGSYTIGRIVFVASSVVFQVLHHLRFRASQWLDGCRGAQPGPIDHTISRHAVLEHFGSANEERYYEAIVQTSLFLKGIAGASFLAAVMWFYSLVDKGPAWFAFALAAMAAILELYNDRQLSLLMDDIVRVEKYRRQHNGGSFPSTNS